jgi:hypothetical protein
MTICPHRLHACGGVARHYVYWAGMQCICTQAGVGELDRVGTASSHRTIKQGV